jgi:hypothetical protein
LCRNCLLKYIIEGKIRKDRSVERQGRTHRQLLDDLKEMRKFWKLKEEALDCTLWRSCFGRGCGSAVKQTIE